MKKSKSLAEVLVDLVGDACEWFASFTARHPFLVAAIVYLIGRTFGYLNGIDDGMKLAKEHAPECPSAAQVEKVQAMLERNRETEVELLKIAKDNQRVLEQMNLPASTSTTTEE